MPRGLAKIDQLAKEAQARRDSYGTGEGINRALILKNGQTARGRFLEEGTGVWYVYTHDLPKKPGQQYADRVLCLDQALTDETADSYVDGSTPCPGCEMEIPRKTRVIINFIRYDEPKLVRDAKGSPVKNANNDYQFDGVEPAVVVCDFATGAGGRISFLESQKGPITQHVCTIHKTGDKNNPFNIDVDEANVAPNEVERALYAKKVTPPKAIQSVFPRFKSIPLLTYGDMKQRYGGAGAATGFSAANEPTGGLADNVYAQQAHAAATGQINLGAFGN